MAAKLATRISMRKCEDCKIILDDDVRFCPNCGNEVGDTSAVGDEQDVRLAALLTSANLHRIKREWDAAITDATEALRIAPRSAEVASLLATIYEQRGNLDEAAVWYRIALDLDPQSVADRARLERVSRIMSESTAKGKTPWPGGISKGLIAAIASGAAVVVLALILFLALRGPRHEASKRANVRAARPSERAPVRAVTSESARPAEQVGQPVSTPLAGAGGSIYGVRTAAEAAIREAIAGAHAVRAAGVTVDDVIADPRQGAVVVTLSVPMNAALTRDGIASAAAAAARTAFIRNAEVQTVTIRCVTSVGDPSRAQILFVGDTTRSAIMSVPENAGGQQAQAVFTNPWWHPQMGGSE